MKLPTALMGAIEATVNRLLHSDPASETRLADLKGHRIRMQVSDLGLGIDFLAQDSGFLLEPASDVRADLEMSGAASAFARAALAPDRGGTGRGVEIRGDADLARRFAEMLQSAEIDIEAILADYLGDSAAHLVGQGLKTAVTLGRQTLKSLSLDTVEYLREESRDLVPRPEMEDWMRQVESLRDAVERLEVRINRIHRTGRT